MALLFFMNAELRVSVIKYEVISHRESKDKKLLKPIYFAEDL